MNMTRRRLSRMPRTMIVQTLSPILVMRGKNPAAPPALIPPRLRPRSGKGWRQSGKKFWDQNIRSL